MNKTHKRKLSFLLMAILVLTYLMPVNAYARSQSNISFNITPNPTVGDTVEVNAVTSSSVRKVTWSLFLDNSRIKINFKKSGGTFIADKSGTYILTCTVSGKRFTETYTNEIIVSEPTALLPTDTPETEEPESSAEETTSVIDDGIPSEENSSIVEEETSSVENSTTVEEETSPEENSTTVEEETSSVENSTTVEEETSSEENSTTVEEETSSEEVSTELVIILEAPEEAQIDTPIPVSLTTANCSYIEWYINGDYHSELAKQINPEGTLQFTTAGTYKITVIGYTQDWSEHVKASKTITVTDASSSQGGNAKDKNRAMYSWNHEYIYETNEALLQQVMELTECNILYQDISSDDSAEVVSDFLRRRGEKGQTVYYLCGDASWCVEPNAESMLEEIERVAAYNAAAGEYKFVGIQFDVEPHCLADFEENADAYMTQYVENCKLAYNAAKEAGILVELCIPYWWDSGYGFESQLENLIANACDSIAVMNYHKNNIAAHIETEVNLCKQYNKAIINITEMQAPGTHGLTDNNTYYNDGIDAVEEMWNSLDSYFGYENLGYSYHYLDVMIELLAD